jgi:hypothetical protein
VLSPIDVILAAIRMGRPFANDLGIYPEQDAEGQTLGLWQAGHLERSEKSFKLTIRYRSPNVSRADSGLRSLANLGSGFS